MKKPLSFLALILIALGMTLIVIGYADVSKLEMPEEFDEPEEPEYPPEWDDENGDGTGHPPREPYEDPEPPPIPPKGEQGPLNIFGMQVSQMEVLGFALIGFGVALLFLKR